MFETNRKNGYQWLYYGNIGAKQKMMRPIRVNQNALDVIFQDPKGLKKEPKTDQMWYFRARKVAPKDKHCDLGAPPWKVREPGRRNNGLVLEIAARLGWNSGSKMRRIVYKGAVLVNVFDFVFVSMFT